MPSPLRTSTIWRIGGRTLATGTMLPDDGAVRLRPDEMGQISVLDDSMVHGEVCGAVSVLVFKTREVLSKAPIVRLGTSPPTGSVFGPALSRSEPQVGIGSNERGR